MKCPKCGLYNPDIAMRCDCGYDFDTKEMKESFLGKTSEKPSSLLFIISILSAIVGGWLGVFVNGYIAFGKNPNGYKYVLESRKTAKILLIISIIIGVGFAALRLAK